MAFGTLCNGALAAGRTLQKWLASQLGDREKEILTAAARDGQIQLVDYGGLRVVYAGEREFSDDEDAAIAAHYLDAFTKLCERGLVIHHGDEMFRLTGQGFDLGRGLQPGDKS